MAGFSSQLLKWYNRHGRKDLPWQQDISPYRVWVSEIMLQQTQVSTVIPYFNRFMDSFPDVETLAIASEDSVLHHWTGLGYYARCRNLHKTARLVTDKYNGEFPQTVEELETLPGIGRSTAGAIVSIACGEWAPILDGNVKRVLARYYAIEGWPGKTAVQKQLWEKAEQLTPKKRTAEYTQAIMDLGATLCTRSKPACDQCPVSTGCEAFKHGIQDRLPGRKPPRQKPVQSCCVLLLENKHRELLLERRPPSGIWGGLWSLPESTDRETIPQVMDSLGIKAEIIETLPQLKHSFSHYDLLMTPVRLKLRGNSAKLLDREQRLWYNPSEPVDLGLAAPIKKLIQSKQVNQ